MDMETIYCSLTFIASIFILYNILTLVSKTNHKKCPPSIPILGHLRLLKPPVHRTLHSLAQLHGPIFSLRLGTQPAVVVSAASAAEECFTQNDVIFANRPNFLMGRHLGYGNTVLVWAPYGPHWRNLRRVATITALSQKQVQLMGPARRFEVRSLVRELVRRSGRGVNLNEVLGRVTRNVVMRAVNGRRWEIPVMKQPMNLMTVCDFLPVLRWVGFKGIEREMIQIKKERDAMMQGLVDEYRERRAFRRTGGGHAEEKEKTMLDELLDLQEAEPEYYTDDILKGLRSGYVNCRNKFLDSNLGMGYDASSGPS